MTDSLNKLVFLGLVALATYLHWTNCEWAYISQREVYQRRLGARVIYTFDSEMYHSSRPKPVLLARSAGDRGHSRKSDPVCRSGGDSRKGRRARCRILTRLGATRAAAATSQT